MSKCKKVYFSEHQLRDLPLFCKNKSNESKIFLLNDHELLKLFHFMSDNKLLTLQLMENRMQELHIIKEFVLFQKYAFVKNKLQGILMPKGYDRTLYTFSNHPNTSYQDKIIVLKQIGMVLEQLKNLREKENLLTDFFIGDIHENNILVNPNTLQIQFVDLDSCKIGNNRAFLTKYLQFLKTYSYVRTNLGHKYPCDIYNFGINENTDLYCYIVILFNVLFSVDISLLDVTTYNHIVEQLYSYGLPSPLYESFIRLYQPEENTNPYLYLEDIPKTFERNLVL